MFAGGGFGRVSRKVGGGEDVVWKLHRSTSGYCGCW